MGIIQIMLLRLLLRISVLTQRLKCYWLLGVMSNTMQYVMVVKRFDKTHLPCLSTKILTRLSMGFVINASTALIGITALLASRMQAQPILVIVFFQFMSHVKVIRHNIDAVGTESKIMGYSATALSARIYLLISLVIVTSVPYVMTLISVQAVKLVRRIRTIQLIH